MRGINRWWSIMLAIVGILMGTIGGAEESGRTDPKSVVSTFDDASVEFFEKEVRPILVAKCMECHGNGQGDPKGGLRLNSRVAVLNGGDTGPAVVPGKLKESLLVSAIQYGDLYQMPPKSKLPAREIAVLTKWVEMGAPWSQEKNTAAGPAQKFDLASRIAQHWCWSPISDPPIPAVKCIAWPNTSVDRFILAKLEEKNLGPAATAEKHALLRRVYFDLIGLPPTPEEVDAFLIDASPQAYERVVDRLLDSVQYGERWARHWLDLVRYAETRGHEFEPIIPNAWQYRDYMIRAINADVPHDRLLMEHIAGDLIEPRWRQSVANQAGVTKPNGHATGINEAILGTGFWFLGEEVHSPVDIRKDETDRMDNRLDVMSKTFLGLTVGCARCHDHKFDAISQRDYYALVGYLISSSYRQIRVQTHENDRLIAEELDEIRDQTRRATTGVLVAETKPALAKLDRYLLTGRALVDAGVTIEESPTNSPPNEVVFADFEFDSWGDWKTEGTAFGDGPHRKGDNIYEAPLEGFRGERLANSHRNAINGPNTAAARDAHIGRLISRAFTIQHDSITFLIGGGAYAGRTCMNLIVDGKPVRTAIGQNSGNLRAESWQVADLRGKSAQIEIVDAEPGSWGHILIDQIVFSNGARAETTSYSPPRLSTSSRQRTKELAASKELNAEILERWCVELMLAKSDRTHPLNPLVESTDRPASKAMPAASKSRSEGLVVDFGELRRQDVIQDGVSFGVRPAHSGQLQIGGSVSDPKLHVTTVGSWNRDLFWKDLSLSPETDDDHGGMGSWHRHGRMVRTPEFTLSSNRVWYLVRGSVRAYAVVNSHLVIAGPLHGSLLREFKKSDQQWRWVEHGLELYRGNRLHIEFCPGDDDECAIAMVVQSNDPPKMPNSQMELTVGLEEIPLSEQAVAIQQRLIAVISGFKLRQDRPVRSVPFTSGDAALANWFLTRHDLFTTADLRAALSPLIQNLRRRETQLAEQVQWESQLAPAMLDGNGFDEHLLIRGNSNTPRDQVHRRFLEAVAAKHGSNVDNAKAGPELDASSDLGSGRVQLAQRMINSPLAARVAVNRVWHHLFGRGIVPSVDNMGVLGQPPTHPELLDHLATAFIKDGWSTKRLIKSLVLSQTYQMSSHPSEPAAELDPDNLLWHRMPIKRLEGEAIRDALLAVSGRLNKTSFGPSVPIHLTPFMEGRGRPGVSGPLDGNGRRSIYIAVRRNFLSPMMLAFDTPSPFSTVGRRTSSNVPAQALILMNDPLVIDLAKTWANRLLAAPSQTSDQRIDTMYMMAYSRKATAAEKSEAIEFLDAQGARLGVAEAQRRESPQAWADLCHVLFNLKEFVFIE